MVRPASVSTIGERDTEREREREREIERERETDRQRERVGPERTDRQKQSEISNFKD